MTVSAGRRDLGGRRRGRSRSRRRSPAPCPRSGSKPSGDDGAWHVARRLADDDRDPRSTPAASSRSAARAVSKPASRLPGQTGWSSAAPVATTISPAGRGASRARSARSPSARRRSRRPRRRRPASRTRTVRPARPRPGGGGRAALAGTDDDQVHRQTAETDRRGRAASAVTSGLGHRMEWRPARHPGRVARAPRGPAGTASGRSGSRRCRPPRRRSCRSRRPGTRCPPRPGCSPAAQERDRDRVARLDTSTGARRRRSGRRRPPRRSLAHPAARWGRTAARAAAAPADAGR